jgi:rhodanese-related sulfurtransferase
MAHATIRMEELHANEKYAQPGKLVLDVRSRPEYRRGHVPGSLNIPVRDVERDPARVHRQLLAFDEIYIHCSSGHRSKRACDALARTGLTNLVHVSGSGMPEWVRQHYPVEREISLARDVVTGMAAGLLADLAVAQIDKALGALVSEEQKRRESAVREGSPHEVGGTRIGEKIAGRRLSRPERRKAQIAFTVGYGVLWGAVYALVRRRMPLATSLFGLPYAVAFFFACDGFLAPLLRMTPGLQKIPWQFNAKELANHAAWTATAEAVHRGTEKAA